MARLLNKNPSVAELKDAHAELQRCYALRGVMPYMGGSNVMDVPLDEALALMFERVRDDNNRKDAELANLRALREDVEALRRLLKGVA